MSKGINALAFGYAGGTLAAACMLLLGILGKLGVYLGAVGMMQTWHLFFTLSIGGIIAGMVEAAVIGFVTLYALGWLYNKFS